MEHRYKQLMRRVKLYLLTEIRKKSWTSKLLSANIFDHTYWAWDKPTVARGAVCGSIAAIAPLPMQCLWGVLGCYRYKGNIPIAVLAAWLSPPGFTFFAIPAQWWLGMVILTRLGVSASGATWQIIKDSLQQWSTAPFAHVNTPWMIVEFLLGWAISSLVIAVISYGFVHGVWGICSALSRHTHKDKK